MAGRPLPWPKSTLKYVIANFCIQFLTSVVTCWVLGCSTEQPAAHGVTPLVAAMANGHTEVIHVLLDAGCLPDLSEVAGVELLRQAILDGDSKIAQPLFDTGCCTDRPGLDCSTPLHVAAAQAHSDHDPPLPSMLSGCRCRYVLW